MDVFTGTEGDVDAMKTRCEPETGSAALALPHLRRRHSRPCSSGDAGVQFRSNEFSLCVAQISGMTPPPVMGRTKVARQR